MPELADPRNFALFSAVIAALVAGLFSLIGIIFTQRKARQAQESITRLSGEQARALERLRAEQTEVLETIKARLGEERDERAARRDYEYEARKRLYEECDPLLFQFVELSANALGRITNLARACRDESLQPDGSGWLDHEGYYFLTTLYRLMVPCAIFQLLQRRLTLLDLRLDGRISTQFLLCRMLYRTFRDDWDLANASPKLPYNPDHPHAGSLVADEPSVYRRQGVYAGQLELIVEALIVSEPGQPSRYLRYGEFASAYQDEQSLVHRAFAPVAQLFYRFHPAIRPVLWRILVAQAFVYRAVGLSGDLGTGYADGRQALLAALEHPPGWLDWTPASGETGSTLDASPVGAALRYLKAGTEPALG
jgi:hypothetical protein